VTHAAAALVGVRGQVGREGEMLLRFQSREPLRQGLVDYRIGVAAIFPMSVTDNTPSLFS
jgi:hypothetical protein